MTEPRRDHTEALLALERLVHRQILTEDQARGAARLITGDPDTPFPPPRPAAPAAPPPPAAPPAEAPPAPPAEDATPPT